MEHKYYYSGVKLLRETYNGNILDFAYNSDGSLYSLRINGTYYYYVTNLQGDVIAIVDADGNNVASYEYDPYGDIISASGTLAEINPLRYRGYYYDTETQLYYLQSRYYDPALGRFINADAFASTGQGLLDNNMFTYCGNNPVNKIDKTGNLGLAIGLFIGASAVIGGLAGAFTAACTGSNVFEGALEGAALGAVAATATIVAPLLLPTTASTAVTVGVTFVAAGAGGMVVDYTTQRVSHELSENSNEDFKLNKGRLIKTGFTTGIAGVVPTYGNPGSSVLNAGGSLVMGFDASFFNAAAEIAITHFLK